MRASFLCFTGGDLDASWIPIPGGVTTGDCRRSLRGDDGPGEERPRETGARRSAWPGAATGDDGPSQERPRETAGGHWWRWAWPEAATGDCRRSLETMGLARSGHGRLPAGTGDDEPGGAGNRLLSLLLQDKIRALRRPPSISLIWTLITWAQQQEFSDFFYDDNTS